MAEFKGLGIVNMEEDELTDHHTYDNSEKSMTLKNEFKWFLSEEFRNLREGFELDLEHYGNNILTESADSMEESERKNTP